MTLREKQTLFVRLAGKLIARAFEMGYEPTFGEAFRTPEQAALNARAGTGIAHSLHCDRLALDLILFRDGVWLQQSEQYEALGEWWESQSTAEYQCAWGGRFRDGNHFSIAHEGRK